MTEKYINREAIDKSKLVFEFERWMARNKKAYRPMKNNDWFESIEIHENIIEIQAFEYDPNLVKDIQITRVIPITPHGYDFFKDFKTAWIFINLDLITRDCVLQARKEVKC